jgi:hypothetical protein
MRATALRFTPTSLHGTAIDCSPFSASLRNATICSSLNLLGLIWVLLVQDEPRPFLWSSNWGGDQSRTYRNFWTLLSTAALCGELPVQPDASQPPIGYIYSFSVKAPVAGHQCAATLSRSGDSAGQAPTVEFKPIADPDSGQTTPVATFVPSLAGTYYHSVRLTGSVAAGPYERITSTLFQVYAPAATIGSPMTQRIDLVMPAQPQ